MGQPSFFDNVREFIARLAWRVYLWGARMTEEEFLAEHERQAVEQIRAADGACALCNGEVTETVFGFCKSCRVENPPRN